MKTQIEKSHSKFSNFKLTLLSFFTIIFITLFVLLIIIYPKMQTKYYYPLLIMNAFLSLICLVLFDKFTR